MNLRRRAHPVSTPAPRPCARIASAALIGLLLASCNGDRGAQTEARTVTLAGAEGNALRIERELPREVQVGEELVYELRVANVSDGPVRGVVLRERLPEGFEASDTVVLWGTTADDDDEQRLMARAVDPSTGRPVEAAAPRIEGLRGGGELIFELGELAPDEQVVLRVHGVAHSEGSTETCLVVTYDSPVCMPWNIVRPELHLVRELELEGDAAWICEEIPVRYRLTNQGTGTTEPGTIRERLPEGLRTAGGDAEVALEFDALGPEETFEETVHLRADRGGTYEGRALAVTERLEVRSEPRSLRVLEPRVELHVEPLGQLVREASLERGVVVENAGDDPLEGVVVALEDVHGAGVELRPAHGAEQRGAGEVELGRMEPGARRELVLVLRAEDAEELRGRIVVRGRCLSEERAAVLELHAPIVGVAALRLELSGEPDPVRVGGTAIWLVRVHNQGTEAERAVELLLELPRELEYVDGEGATTPRAEEPGRVNLGRLGTLEPGDSAEWRVEVRALQAGSTAVRAQLSSEASPVPVRAQGPTRIVE